MKLTALMIDGGHLRATANRTNVPAAKAKDARFIAEVARNCFKYDEEEIYRVLFYDCRLYEGDVQRPITGTTRTFKGDDNAWMDELSKANYFALRTGVLTFRGWRLRREFFQNPRVPEDHDFEPIFEQKGVDMRIGLDIAVLADTRTAQRVFLMTGDSDFIPAIKHGRKAGLQMGLIVLPQTNPKQLYPYVDMIREIRWPERW